MGGFIVYNSYQNINMICSFELISGEYLLTSEVSMMNKYFFENLDVIAKFP